MKYFQINRWLPALLLLPVVAWTVSIFSGSVFTSSTQPAGQLYYVASKSLGLLAITIAGMQVLIGYSQTPVFRRIHIGLGLALLLTAIGHWWLFSYAVMERTGSFPFENLIPITDGKYYHTGIMFGALAFWLLVTIVVTGIGQFKQSITARVFHRLGVGVFLLAVIHALMIGTEANGLTGKLYLISWTSLIVLATFLRWKFVLNISSSNSIVS